MKPVFARISEIVENEIFMTKEIILPLFSTEFHFHEESQLVYIVESEGTRLVGDSVESFAPGEMVLVGPNTPHVWYNGLLGNSSEQRKEKASAGMQARSLAIYFNASQLASVMDRLSPSPKLDKLLALSPRGIVFQGETKDRLLKLFYKILDTDGLTRVITFFEIMQEMSEATDFRVLSSADYVNRLHVRDQERMDKVIKFVLDNFKRDIQLDEVAALVEMNKQAFCRYFKSRTGKTLVDIINRMRIKYACQEMQSHDCQIAALAANCGFKSLSNFNRFFKEITGLTPREYKKQIASGPVINE